MEKNKVLRKDRNGLSPDLTKSDFGPLQLCHLGSFILVLFLVGKDGRMLPGLQPFSGRTARPMPGNGGGSLCRRAFRHRHLKEVSTCPARASRGIRRQNGGSSPRFGTEGECRQIGQVS